MAGPWAVTDSLGSVVYDPLPHQHAYHASTARYRLLGGSKGCGKSKGGRWDHHLFHLMVPGSRGLITRRLLTELQRSHLRDLPADIQGMGGEVAGFQWKPSDVGAGVLWYPNGSSLEFGHLQHEHSVDTYLSAAYERVTMDEIVTCTDYQHLMLCSCLRTTIPGVIPQFGAATNPGASPKSEHDGLGVTWVERRWVSKDVTADEDEVYNPDDYHYIPALPSDNPYLNWAEYHRELSRLPTEMVKAYRDGRWDSFPGQFFPEFARATHALSDAEVARYQLPPAYAREASLRWGYAEVGVVLFSVLADDGTLIVEDELVFNGPTKNKRVPSEVAAEVRARVQERGWTVRRWLANPQMGEQRGAAGGETHLGTFARAGVPLRAADDDRVNGWGRVRAWLRVNPVTGKPFLRVHPRCRYTLRTIGAVRRDEGHPEDVDAASETAAVDALRFVVMGRPSPSREKPVITYPPGTVGWLKQRAMQPPARGVLGVSNKSRRDSLSKV